MLMIDRKLTNIKLLEKWLLFFQKTFVVHRWRFLLVDLQFERLRALGSLSLDTDGPGLSIDGLDRAFEVDDFGVAV